VADIVASKPIAVRLGHRIRDQRHRQGEHDCRAEALHGSCADQPAIPGPVRSTTTHGEKADADQQQAPPPEHIAQTPDADNQRGDRQQVTSTIHCTC
jgi:hypothetical protein